MNWIRRRIYISVLILIFNSQNYLGIHHYVTSQIDRSSPRDSLRYFPLKLNINSPDKNLSDSLYLLKIANDTWKFFDNSTYCSTGLIVDNINVKNKSVANFTSITNIGLYILSLISARELNFIDDEAVLHRIETTLNSLKGLEKYNGFLFNWYDLKMKRESSHHISSVDAGWLYSSLVVLASKYPQFKKECDELISKADFGWLYNDSVKAFSLGYNSEEKKFSQYNYELLCSESRITFYYAVSQNQISAHNWYYKKRTLPETAEQNQKPKGGWKTINGIKYFEGYYTYEDKKIIPSWGGSMFEYLMPSLLINEKEIAPSGIGLNNKIAIDIHIDYALNKLKYPVWGLSPSQTPSGKYDEFGVPLIATKQDGYSTEIISPYASILAISYKPEAVIENLKKLTELYPIYGEYGFYDCVNPKTKEVGYSYLALDQAMILISLTNYLKDNLIAKRFMDNQSARGGLQKLFDLISKEKIFD